MIRNILVSLGLAAAFAASVSSGSQAAGLKEPLAPCHEKILCPVGERGYHAKLPDNWDGKSSLPVLLHFHGWARQGTLIVKHGRIAGATRKSGVLLLAPNGLGKSWDFWTADTDDVSFALSVLEDAAKRWPIDKSRIYVSGYSYGSAMAWRFACAEGDRIAALLAVAGTLYDQNEDCKTGPVHVRHVHGTNDTVMDFPFGRGGDVKHPVALWRTKNGCMEQPDSVTTWNATKRLSFDRYEWRNCASGKSVTLDVHPRGHFIPRGWIQKQLDQLLDTMAAE
ncbi:MAG: polyhydroxybutyrate depolymerase [Pseudomonadota bacterium]